MESDELTSLVEERRRRVVDEGRKPWDENLSYFSSRVIDDATVELVEKFHDLRSYDCAICMSSMTRTNVSVVVPCFHRFCYKCIKVWSKKAGPEDRNAVTCPVCRTNVSTLLYSIRTATLFKSKDFPQGEQDPSRQPEACSDAVSEDHQDRRRRVVERESEKEVNLTMIQQGIVKQRQLALEIAARKRKTTTKTMEAGRL